MSIVKVSTAMKVFVTNIVASIIFLLFNVSCSSIVENNNCSINHIEYLKIIEALVESDSLIFKGMNNKKIGLFKVSFLLKEKVSEHEIPPVPMGGTILLSDITFKNIFKQNDVEFIKCQIENQKNTSQILIKIFEKLHTKHITNVNKNWISFGLPIFSSDRKNVFIRVEEFMYGSIDSGQGYDILLKKEKNQFEIVSAIKKWE